MTGAEALDAVAAGYRLPNPEDNKKSIQCPSRVYDQMLNCWHEDPADRPSFAQLHSFLSDLLAEEDTPYQFDNVD